MKPDEHTTRDKWEELKSLIDADISHAVHYSNDKLFEHNQLLRVKGHMKYLEEKEKRERELFIDKSLQKVNETHGETLKMLDDKPKGFLYTGVPEFDKKTWEKMLNNLQGLS